MIARSCPAIGDNATPDMQGDIGPDSMRFTGEDGMRLNRGTEVFAEDGFEARLDMTPKRVPDIDLLTRDGQLHLGKPPNISEGPLASRAARKLVTQRDAVKRPI